MHQIAAQEEEKIKVANEIDEANIALNAVKQRKAQRLAELAKGALAAPSSSTPLDCCAAPSACLACGHALRPCDKSPLRQRRGMCV